MANTIEVLITVPFPDSLLTTLHEVSPRLRFTVQVAHKPEEISPEIWARTEILYTAHLLPDVDKVPNLRWIQFHYAGIDFISQSPLLEKPNLAMTNLSGANSIQVAEYAVMMMLALGHKLPQLMAAQSRTEWPTDRVSRYNPGELYGSTVGIISYGSTGRQIARLLQPFGVTLLATKRDVLHPQDTGYTQSGQGDPEGNLFTRLYPVGARKSMLKRCDFIVISLPLTQDTKDLFGAAELAIAKPTAFLIDISRGGIVSHNALISALQERRLAGAALDVFPEEPLPATNPLWRMPSVIVTPHISGISQFYNERAVALFAENLNRYLEGQPLYNLFDQNIGY
jgi:phosphoglycerate dehydrogenase-like enzyme